jgi:hypothetical protein
MSLFHPSLRLISLFPPHLCRLIFSQNYTHLYFCLILFLYFKKYTGCFIMFSAITKIYNKKTKGLTLMKLFTAIEKLKKFLFDN